MPKTAMLLEGEVEGVTLMVAVTAIPLRVAVTAAEAGALTMAAVTGKTADVEPCGTVSVAGTLMAAGFELESDIAIPPEPAGPESVTVPLADWPLAIIIGATAMLFRVGGLMVRPNVSFMPRYEAVRVTGVGTDTLPAVTLNVVDVEPCGIVTVGGSVATPGDEAKAITAPEDGAGAVNATRQLDALGGVTETGMHEKPFRPGVCRIVTIPLLVDAGRDAASASAAAALENWTVEDVFLVELDNVKDTLATTPFEIAVAFRPHRTH